MKTELWLLYESQFDVTPCKIPYSMARHAEKYEISFDIKFIEYFKIKESQLFYNDTLVDELPKMILFRGYNLELCEYFENCNCRVINNLFAMKNCKDKLLTYNLLSEKGVDQPKTMFFSSYNDIKYDEIKNLFGSKFIFKDRYGQKGNNVFLITCEKEWEQVKNNICNDDFIIQEFIESSTGVDLRVYIVGREVVGSIIRHNSNDFRANINQGGSFKEYELDEYTIKLALDIAKELQGEVIAVDFLFGKNKLIFCEANTNAGLKSFNRLGYPMTSIIMKYVCEEFNKIKN